MTQGTSARATAGRDDRLTLPTRLAFTPLALVTAIFGPVLVLFPGDTPDYWAWPIAPDMSAVWVGAGYTFGAIAITSMLVQGRSSASVVAIGGTWPFAVVMLAATIIHNDRFFTDTAGYYLWLFIYVVLPFALPPLLWLELKHDPGRRDTDVVLPPWLRWSLVAAGAIVTLVGLVLVLEPGALDQSWPWRLTPLMSRVIGGWLLFIGAGGLSALLETRYVAYRYYFIAATIWFSVLLAASIANAGDFRSDGLATPLYFATAVASILGVAGAFVYMERSLHGRRV